MAYEDIKDKGFDTRTTEELQEITRKGGINSGIARREKATMKKTLEMMLDSTYKSGKTYRDEVTLGLLANAINKDKGGNPKSYEIIMKILGELNDSENNTNEMNKNLIDIAKLLNNPVKARTEDDLDE